MADLEDRIFKQNVPGRWSSLQGESDDTRIEEVVDNDKSDDDE